MMPQKQFPEDLEEMSTASLEKLLLWDFQLQEPGESDMRSLFRVSEILAERETSRANADQAWELFVEKYLPYARADSALYDFAETQSVSAPAVQPALPFRRPPPASASMRRTSPMVCPPEGYQKLGKRDSSFSWKNEEGSLLLYTHASARSKRKEVERHRAAVKGLAAQDVLVKGGPASYCRDSDGTAHLVWTDGSGGFCWISGPLPLEDLIRMAEEVTSGP